MSTKPSKYQKLTLYNNSNTKKKQQSTELHEINQITQHELIKNTI